MGNYQDEKLSLASSCILPEDINPKRKAGLFKRLFDILFSSLSILIVVIPCLIVFGILIKLESKGPVIYKQKRVGKDGKIFTMYKIRSMTVDAEKTGPKLTEEYDERVTRIGKLLRLARIDELPQFFNVFKGDMSVVGPRPERPCFTIEYAKKIPDFIERLKVKPGISGWAQVSAEYDVSPDEKLKLDLYYIQNYSLWLDLKIIFKTIRVMLSRFGAR